MIRWYDKYILRFDEWFRRHIVQRVRAPALLDAKDKAIEKWQEESARSMEIAFKRGRDNRTLMREVCGRIADFKEASSRLAEVDIHIHPQRRIHFAVLADRDFLKVERAGDCETIPIDEQSIYIEDYTARVSLGLFLPDDYPPEQVRWATAVLLIDQLAHYIARHTTQQQLLRTPVDPPRPKQRIDVA